MQRVVNGTATQEKESAVQTAAGGNPKSDSSGFCDGYHHHRGQMTQIKAEH